MKNSLISNLNTLMVDSGIKIPELANSTKIPKTTLYGILSGENEPRLSNLKKIAEFFNITISQLIGESALSCTTINIPVFNWSNLNWNNLDKLTENVDFSAFDADKYLSIDHINDHFFYALYIESDHYPQYKKGTVLIVNYRKNFSNNDMILISINNDHAVLKKVIMEDGAIYLASLSDSIPLVKYSDENCVVFGVIKEIRLFP